MSANDDRVRSNRADRDQSAYYRKRATQARRRAKLERTSFDPSPPTDDDWVVEDRSGLRRVPTGPEPLAELLDKVIGQRDWDQRLRSASVFDRWEEVIGADLAQHCKPLRLAGGVLTLVVTDQMWATQIRYLTAELKRNVNAALGEPMVETVDLLVRPASQG